MRQLPQTPCTPTFRTLLHLPQERGRKDVPPLEEREVEVKRTPLKRGNKPLKRYTPLKKSKPKKSEPGSSAYLKWIRTLPCVVCDGVRGKSEAAHTLVYGNAGTGKKSTYRSCIPLCIWDHTLRFDSYHGIRPESEWAEVHSLDLNGIVQSLNDLWESVRRKKAA